MSADIDDIVENMSISCRDLLTKDNELRSRLSRVLKTISDEDVNRAIALLSLLNNPIRFKIIYYLSQSPLPVCILTYLTGAEQTAVSHHLAILRKHGVIDVRIAGKYRIYYLKDEGLKHLLYCLFSINQ